MPDLPKLSRALGVVASMVASGDNPKNNDQFGEALVRAGVIGSRDANQTADAYLAEQRAKPASSQSHRTVARGLRQLFRDLGCMEQNEESAWLTPVGATLARGELAVLDDATKAQWRVAIANLAIGTPSEGVSHPYRVLLRLVKERPGLEKKKSALCLEAANDSTEELDRVLKLADIEDVDQIRQEIGGVSKNNWENAIKILPSIAVQLGDLQLDNHCLYPTDTEFAARPEASDRFATQTADRAALGSGVGHAPGERPQGRTVDAKSIARAGTGDEADDARSLPAIPSEEEAAATQAVRAQRLTRHNKLVRHLAERLASLGATLREDPYDCLATADDYCYLIEVKSLNGEPADERTRVRDALSQLLYYQSLCLPEDVVTPTMIAAFESKPSDTHIAWLKAHEIITIWFESGRWVSPGTNELGVLEQLAECDPA